MHAIDNAGDIRVNEFRLAQSQIAKLFVSLCVEAYLRVDLRR
jgi:hypothetical protein